MKTQNDKVQNMNKVTGFLFKIIIGFIVLVAMLRMTMSPEEKARIDRQNEVDRVARIEQDKREAIAKAEADKKWEVEYRLMQLLEDYVTSNLHDPDSLKIVDKATSRKGAQCMTFTATNAFGGRVKGIASLHNGKLSMSAKVFKKVCL